MAALSDRVTARGQTLYLTLVTTDAARDAVLAHASGGLLDGVILRSTHGDDPLFRGLLAAGTPAVVFGEPLGAGRKLPHVKVDDRAGARTMARHLTERGYREIALITGPLDTASARNRLAGFRDVLGADRPAVSASAYSTLDGHAAMRSLLREGRPDAVFAASDVLASGALLALREAGLRVPADVALGGFDDSGLAQRSDPPLTTVRIAFDEQAEAAVSLLARVIAGESPESVTGPATLVVRAST
ncbi:LacI family DNA-binding transcriptional regulator [Cryptosporangium phraense]|uniref:LacI family DNA-binding transcriptional regulator n=1 Tax=Cryptosporangium phraense TaxID=2593070 RepID=UPI00147893D0|nr:substrate-binding domain-containing protein [Cryptosporangium phraense]